MVMVTGSIECAEELESRVRWYSRRIPVRFARAKDARLWDDKQNEYIDFLSGAGVLNYGHNPEALKQALLEYLLNDGIVQSLDLHTVAKHAFIEMFQHIILRPRGMAYRIMFCGPTGANAVEAAFKLARKVTGRPNIAAFTNGFHGMSLGALAAVGSEPKRHAAGTPLSNVDRYPYDCYFGDGLDTIEFISRLLEDQGSGFDPPAAFIVETVQGEGGVNAASAIWLYRLQELAKRHNSLFIVDDIQAGCGRTGHFFSFEHAGVTPDIICLSKAISGYGLPLSLNLIAPTIDLWEPGEHSGTFRGQNFAFVTARAALEYWKDPSFLGLVSKNIGSLDHWMERISAEVTSGPLDLRGRGLIRGIGCHDAAIARRVCEEAFKRGVILETSGPRDEVIKFLPPLNIDPVTMSEALARLEDAFSAAFIEQATR